MSELIALEKEVRLSQAGPDTRNKGQNPDRNQSVSGYLPGERGLTGQREEQRVPVKQCNKSYFAHTRYWRDTPAVLASPL